MQVGTHILRIIVTEESSELLDKLKEAEFRVTDIEGEGKFGQVKSLFTVAQRKRWNELSQLLDRYAPDAFYSVEDVRKMSSNADGGNRTKSSFGSRLLTLKRSEEHTSELQSRGHLVWGLSLEINRHATRQLTD